MCEEKTVPGRNTSILRAENGVSGPGIQGMIVAAKFMSITRKLFENRYT